jgi:formylmethanofuran dehydrogenase subunit E
MGDPLKDFEIHDARQSMWLKRRPVCSECDEHIQDECCYEINGELVCEECMEMNHKKYVEDYIE